MAWSGCLAAGWLARAIPDAAKEPSRSPRAEPLRPVSLCQLSGPSFECLFRTEMTLADAIGGRRQFVRITSRNPRIALRLVRGRIFYGLRRPPHPQNYPVCNPH